MRRRTYRKEDKQISFFTSSEIHESIKLEAKRKNTSIKEYLVRLHINATNQSSQDNMISEIHSMMKRLLDNQAFLVLPQKGSANITKNFDHSMQPNRVNQDAIYDHDKVSASSDAMVMQSVDGIAYSNGINFSPRLEEYLSNITRVTTYETMRRIIFALYKLKEATHYQINEEIGHTTHNQPRALKRAVEDRIVLVDESDNPKEPYYYRLNPSYL